MSVSACLVNCDISWLGRETWWDQASRYEQIKRWAHRAAVQDWIAIDDQPEGWAKIDSDRLVLANSALGLSDPSALVCLATALAIQPVDLGKIDAIG